MSGVKHENFHTTGSDVELVELQWTPEEIQANYEALVGKRFPGCPFCGSAARPTIAVDVYTCSKQECPVSETFFTAVQWCTRAGA